MEKHYLLNFKTRIRHSSCSEKASGSPQHAGFILSHIDLRGRAKISHFFFFKFSCSGFFSVMVMTISTQYHGVSTLATFKPLLGTSLTLLLSGRWCHIEVCKNNISWSRDLSLRHLTVGGLGKQACFNGYHCDKLSSLLSPTFLFLLPPSVFSFLPGLSGFPHLPETSV